jgi:hypothetical protein
MDVRVTRLLRRGVAIPRDRMDAPALGTLQSSVLQGRTVLSLTLNRGNPWRVIPDLQCPELVSIGHGAMRLRGVEEDDGRLYAQTWICEVDAAGAVRAVNLRGERQPDAIVATRAPASV